MFNKLHYHYATFSFLNDVSLFLLDLYGSKVKRLIKQNLKFNQNIYVLIEEIFYPNYAKLDRCLFPVLLIDS